MKFLPNLKNVKEPKKAAKCLAVFCALTLGIAAVFYSPSDLSSTTTNDDCALLATGVVAQPGSNCLFSAMDRNGSKVLPLCREIPATSYSIDPSNILSTGTRRVTCSNLSDLPLCPTTPTSADLPGKNCAPLCDGSFSGTGTRSVDYAIHNRDCIRFCDALEADVIASGISAQPNINCVDRKCHQLAKGDVPVSNGDTANCSLMPCNLLTKDELIDVAGKIYNDVEVLHRTAGKYCDGNNDINGKTLKCYEFNKDQLLYVTKGHMCKVHNCPAPCSNYTSPLDVNNDGLIDAYDNDDTLNVTDRDKDPSTPADDTYVANYKTSINNEAELSSSSYCSPIYCRPIITKQFRCVDGSGSVTGDSSKDIFRNSSCDSTGTGATCSNNLCFQTIDCNESVNDSKPECFQSPDGQIGSTNDIVNSEFYRPKPLKKATRIQGSIRIMEDMNGGYPNGELCYTKSQMENRPDNFDDGRGSTSEDGQWGLDMTIRIPMPAPVPDIVIPIGWFHSSLLPDETRSPRACNVPNSGDRGTGYNYLCFGDGNLSQLYAKVADHTAFHKGYVQTNFTEGDGTHKLNVCLRFRSSLRPDDGTSETCGSRQCAINCLFGVCDSQNCGQDRCVELEVADSNPTECEMRSAIAEGNLSKKCMGTFDVKPGLDTEGLRVRIQRYGARKICSFLDVRGQTAYDTVNDLDLFIKGSEKLSTDGSCVNGSKNSSGNCSGYSNYTNPASAEMWRTIKFGTSGNIPYIQNNQPAGQLSGYYDKNGQFFAEQECIYIPLRTAPARIYNLANITNSAKLFTPPIYILNALAKAGSGTPAPRNFGEAFGVTDFNYPAVQVNFGNTTQEISLGALGTELVTGYGDSRVVNTITTTVNEIEYSVDVFARKEFNESSKKPTFCVYRKVVNIANVEVGPERIGCVDRKLPALNDTINKQKTVIYLDPSSTFSSSKIVLRFLGSYGANGIDNNCLAGSDDVCSAEIKFENINSDIPTCNSAVVDPTDPTTISPEMYNLCAKRDECSQLNVECIQNEIALQAAKVAGQGIESFLAVRKRCNEILLPMCNARKGITAPTGDVVNPNPTNAPASPTAYGWFNEICFVSGDKADGFNSHLKQVIAYKTSAQGVKGKCLTHEGPTACPDGGKAPNCNCAVAIDGAAIDLTTQEIRTQTPREAGLCVDMPMPQTCPAIDYNPTSTIPSDPEYVYTSLNQTSYGASQGTISDVVHISHQTRSQASASSHAEFPLSVIGSVDVEGFCGGFWKNSTSPTTGIASAPTRTCVNTNGNASWDSVVKNACSRYSCEARLTTGADSEADNASYQGGYASSETGEAKGSSDGFATWPSYLKTNDFPEDVNALACIPGFKKIGANSTIAGTPIRTYETQISGYSGGNSPIRKCNQIGTWQNPTNACERIKCPAITPPTEDPANFTLNDWIKWYDAGGATFPQTNASRSTSAGIVAIGTCNNNIGFFNLGAPPTRRCDYLGNWGPVVNPCTTRCEAITTDLALGSNNGNATWSETNITPPATEQEGVFGSCLSGYVPYPYPPLKNKYGIPYDLARGNITNYNISGVTTIAGNANYESSIPLDVSLDGTRPERIPGDPKKLCRTLTYDGTDTNTWAAANSSCIAGCPGASQDPRVGVGVTQHDSTDGKKTIKWSDGATFGTWYFVASGSPETSVANIPNFTGEDAADFTKDRTNKVFVLARFCGDGNNGTTRGKWEDPIPQCATNGSAPNVGMIADSNAIYNTSSAHNGVNRMDSRTIDVNDSTLATTNSCRTDGNYFKTGSDSTPQNISSYKCVYKSGNNIDEVYFEKIDGEPCKIYCRPPAVGDLFGNSKYTGTPAAPEFTPVNGTLNLGECADGYGKADDNDDDTSDNSCGRTNSDRGATPIVTCQTNGLFGNISNNCTSCFGCSSSSTTIAPSSNIGSGNDEASFDHSLVSSGSTSVTFWSSGQENAGERSYATNIKNWISTGFDNLGGTVNKCSSGVFNNTAHNTCIGLHFFRRVGNDSHTNTLGYLTMKCVDGAFIPEQYQNCSLTRPSPSETNNPPGDYKTCYYSY
ncbi:MAG: hypothetical protein KA100_04245 [Rickettsiales bacterium]|nr:hypothetical protein [Rickettsiales bacterium]